MRRRQAAAGGWPCLPPGSARMPGCPDGAVITVLYASDGVGGNYPIHFFDAAYDADTGSAYFSELTPKEQAEMLVEKAEFPRTIFTEEEKAFVTEYAETFPGQVERLNDLVWDMRKL